MRKIITGEQSRVDQKRGEPLRLAKNWLYKLHKMKEVALIQKIISGGQTGADLAALDFALEIGIPHGGWIPKGRLTEVGHFPVMLRVVLSI